MFEHACVRVSAHVYKEYFRAFIKHVSKHTILFSWLGIIIFIAIGVHISAVILTNARCDHILYLRIGRYINFIVLPDMTRMY